VPSASAIGVALLAPLALVIGASRIGLGEKPVSIAVHFSAGVALAFGALLAEDYLYGVVGPAITEYRLAIENFIFIALIEETLKISLIVQLAERLNAQSLRATIAIALVVAAGFAGAENVVYLFRYADEIPNLLLVRTTTAVPMHLATAIVSAQFIFVARQNSEKSHYYAIALLVATGIHGLYDYLIMASRGRSFAFLFVLGFAVAWAWRIVPSRTSA
jgi:RsiW-degrading membrane proteinase PrsW (M82 family)